MDKRRTIFRPPKARLAQLVEHLICNQPGIDRNQCAVQLRAGFRDPILPKVGRFLSGFTPELVPGMFRGSHRVMDLPPEELEVMVAYALMRCPPARGRRLTEIERHTDVHLSLCRYRLRHDRLRSGGLFNCPIPTTNNGPRPRRIPNLPAGVRVQRTDRSTIKYTDGINKDRHPYSYYLQSGHYFELLQTPPGANTSIHIGPEHRALVQQTNRTNSY